MTTTVVTTKGQIVIPSKIRRKLNIKKGASDEEISGLMTKNDVKNKDTYLI